MRRPSFFTRNNERLSLAPAAFVPIGLLALLGLRFGGCAENSSRGTADERHPSSQLQPTGEEFLIGVLDEIHAISNSLPSRRRQNSHGCLLPDPIMPTP